MQASIKGYSGNTRFCGKYSLRLGSARSTFRLHLLTSHCKNTNTASYTYIQVDIQHRFNISSLILRRRVSLGKGDQFTDTKKEWKLQDRFFKCLKQRYFSQKHLQKSSQRSFTKQCLFIAQYIYAASYGAVWLCSFIYLFPSAVFRFSTIILNRHDFKGHT